MSLCFLHHAWAKPRTFQGKPVLTGIWRGNTTEYVGGEICINFRDVNVRAEEYAQRVGGRLIRGVEPNGFAIIQVDQSEDVPALCEQLYGDPMVNWVEPNLIQTIQEWVPNDPYFLDSTQWALKNYHHNEAYGVPDADIDAPWAWSYTVGDADIVLAILDTGIDMDTTTMTLRHADLNLAGKIILGPDYIGDGYGVADLNGHGTHVSGIASAETNNSTGIAGVAEDCKILMIQVFDSEGYATTTSVSDGINYAVSYQNSHPSQRVIINYSGGGSDYSANNFAALQSAETADVPFVTASGNQASSTCLYPCQHSSDFDNVICVGSTTPQDSRSGFSNYCNDVDVVAPGGTDSPNDENDVFSCLPPNDYGFKKGTSMSTPHVTGICALVVSLNWDITSLDLRNLIQNTADDEVGPTTEDITGYDNYFGYGRANAWSAVIHSPIYTTPYLRNDERCSNTYSAITSRDYRLDAPPTGLWETVAARPHSSINTNVRWLDTDQSTILATSSYTGDNVDFVLAHGRPTTGSDYFARVYNSSGTGKFAVEYQQAAEPYVETMLDYAAHWKSGHVVEIYELYLKNGHDYEFKVTLYGGGSIDAGIALVGPAPAGAYFTNRASAVFQCDVGGNGGWERDTLTVSTGSGWYAFVVYSKDGRNGSIDIGCRELLASEVPHRTSDAGGVDAGNGYYIQDLTGGTTMGVMAVRPNSGSNYNLSLYEFDSYGGVMGYVAHSGYSFSSIDFILFDRAIISPRTYYPLAEFISGGADSSGYVIQTEQTDEVLVSGTNGPYSFVDDNIVHAWDLEMTDGVEYDMIADIVSGALDIGIALYRKDDNFKARNLYLAQDYSSGPGSDEDITWLCDSTGFYTLVAWAQTSDTGSYYIDFELTPPNLETVVATGWDYEFVPRDAGGSTFDNCHITATLPGNTTNTYLNFACRNDGGNPVPATTFYNQLYLDGSFFYERPRSTGLPGNTNLFHLNWLSTNPIRGGKHTVELRLDGTNTILESDETDNSRFRQFVWSPYVLSNDVPINRAPAPPYSSMFVQPNCDGFQYTRTGVYAYGVAICPVANEDYELKLYDDYTGSQQGFDSLRAYTHYLSGYVDYAIGSYTGVQPTVYPGIYGFSSTPGTNNFVIHAIDATGRILTATDEVRRDTLTANEIINVYEAQLTAGTSYTITTTGVSGTADIHLYLYGPGYGYYGRGNFVAASYNIGTMNEQIVYTPASTSYHVIVVCKPNYASLPGQAVYDISLGLTPPNLTYGTPTGWTYPVVPRNVAGADSNNCVLTASLPGNTANTYLNFCSYNQGPIPTSASYMNYIFVDSVSWNGIAAINPHPMGVYSKHLNRLSANVIRGGRHTMAIMIDRNNSIAESNESDNWYDRQFVWTPYILTNYTSVVRNAPPERGSMTYPNCDGFEFTSSWWGATGILSQEVGENYDIKLFAPWVNSETGFGAQLTASAYAAGYCDFIITTDQTGGSETYDVGVVQSLYNPGSNSFSIQQANEQATWYDPGTYGPYTIAAGQVLGVWEVYLDNPGAYTFAVDVTSGTADIETSIYTSEVLFQSRADYFTGGHSNSAPGGGDESFTITNPYEGMYFGWVVHKVSSVDRNLSSTFNLIWGPAANPVPMAVDDLVIERVDSTGVRLIWTEVTQDTTGNPLTVDYYRIHRNVDPEFTPSPGDSLGSATDTTYFDPMVIWNDQKYFYKVIAVILDGMAAARASGDTGAPAVIGRPPRSDAPDGVRSQFRR